MTAVQENRRTDSMRVRLSPEMMERFEALAVRYGMPPATLCAFAIARFVQSEENSLSMSRMAVMEAARRSSDAMNLSPDQLEKVLTPALQAMLPAIALQQQNLPLDDAAH
jgi:predicted DNA-binding protein